MEADQKTILQDIARSGLGAWDAKPFLEKVTGIAPSIIYVFNQETQSSEYSNRSLGRTLGYTDAEIQKMGSDFMPTIAHPDDLPRIFIHFSALQHLTDGEVAQIEYRMKHKTGGWVWLISHDTVFDRGETGAVRRHIGVATDITAQKVAEEHALAEKRAADAANEELRTFAYSVSHDLKAPSNTLDLLLNEIDSVHGAALPDDARDLLGLSQQTVQRMQALIEDVLHYTRVVGESITLEPVALGDVVASVVEDNRSMIVEKGAIVDVRPLPIVAAHPTQMRILFQNLICNALTFHAPGAAPQVVISETTGAGDASLSITVSDNGIGIPNDKCERIFTLFERLHLDEEYSGTGLGLAICRRIALSHGGEITVKSKLGEGSAFTVTLQRP